MPVVLKKDFFEKNTLNVAQDLLGKTLCVESNGGQVQRSAIIETEAYDGEADLACHASKGKTERTKVMYEDAGICYVYLCYGIHWLLNLVTGPKDYPAAVLIRGLEDFTGPGRLTKGMGIDGSFNEKSLNKRSGIWVEDSSCSEFKVCSGPRIGVDYAGEHWSKVPYRFWFSKK